MNKKPFNLEREIQHIGLMLVVTWLFTIGLISIAVFEIIADESWLGVGWVFIGFSLIIAVIDWISALINKNKEKKIESNS